MFCEKFQIFKTTVLKLILTLMPNLGTSFQKVADKK